MRFVLAQPRSRASLRRGSTRLTVTIALAALALATTSATESLASRASAAATTTPATQVESAASGRPAQVAHESAEAIAADAPTTDVRVRPNATTPMECGGPGIYVDSPMRARSAFAEGSRICLRLHIDFPSSTSTGQAIVAVALPPGVTYEPGSALLTFRNTVTAVLDTTQPDPVWRLGDVTDAGRVVQPGGVFEVRLSGIVSRSADGPDPEDAPVAARLRYLDDDGQPQSTGDGVDLLVTAAPPVSVAKDVADVNDAPPDGNAPDTEGVVVHVGDIVTYRIDLSNHGVAASLNALDVLSAVVWDVLPAEVHCADVGTVTDGGVCTNPGDAGQPTFDGSGALSAIRWQLPGDDAIAAGDTRRLGYDVTVPSTAGPAALLTNTAAVRSFRTATNLRTTAEHLPADNVDTTTSPSQWDVPAASDTSSVATAGTALVTVEKAADQASMAIGERAGWTVSVDLPAGGTFFDAAVIDRLPLGLAPDSVQTVSVACTHPDSTSCAIPGGGAELAPAGGPGDETRVGWLLGDLGSDALPRTVTIDYTAASADVPTAVAGVVLTNHAAFSWDTADGRDPSTADATLAESSAEASSDVMVTEPALSIETSVSDRAPAPGDVFGYTVALSNADAPTTSAAFDVTVVDDVPDGVVVAADTVSDAGVLRGDGPAGGGTVTWTLPGPIAAGGDRGLTYSASLAPSNAIGPGAMTSTAEIDSYNSQPDAGRGYSGPQTSTAVSPVFPHVSVAKSVSDPIAYIDGHTSWAITVTSDGDTEAHGVDVVDALPASWSYVPNSATLSVGGGPASQVEPDVSDPAGSESLTWSDVAHLPVGQTAVVVYAAAPGDGVVDDPGVGSAVQQVNSASAAAADGTGAEGNAAGPYHGPDATAAARIDSADVRIEMSHIGVAVAGRPLAWQVLVGNQGGDTATGPFTVTDDLPAGVGSATAGGDGWSCGGAAGSVTCSRSAPDDVLAPGDAFPAITVTLDLPADAPVGVLMTNTARVTARTFDPLPGDNDASDAVLTIASADLALDKQLVGDLIAGRPATYSLTVTDYGPSDTAGPLVVTDDLPDGASFVSVDGDGWSCEEDAVQLSCTRSDPLAAGESAPAVTVVVHVSAMRRADVINSARVDGPAPDPDPVNNLDAVDASPQQSADLSLQKDSVGSFVAGAAGAYRLTVHNAGPASAGPGVEVTDALPAELTFAGFSSPSGPWTCSADGQHVTCDLDGRLGDSDDAVVEIAVAVDSDHLGNTHNEAAVSAPTPDPNDANNVDADDTTNNVVSDLAIETSHFDVATAGSRIAYALSVRNNGPSGSAGPITVTDTLPEGMSEVSAFGADWSCDVSGQTVTCTRQGRIGAGTSAPDITVVAEIAPDAGPARLVNAATVNGPEADPDLSNNAADDRTDVVDSAELRLTKTVVGDDPVAAGTTTAFRIDVQNDGPSDADSVSVSDALPAGMTAVSAVGTGWDCGSAVPITCARDSLAANASAPPITVVAAVGASVPGGTTLVNEATAATSTSGDDPADDTDSAAVDVVSVADLSIDKTHDATTVAAGTSVAFDIAVANSGPSDAAPPVVVTDRLPAGMTYVGSTGLWTCAAEPAVADGQQVSCELDSGSLASGSAAPSLEISVQVSSDADAGILTNAASVTSAATDPTPVDSADTDDVDIVTSADLSIVKSHVGDTLIGDTVDFTLAVANAGPSDARAVEVSDALPTGLAFVSAAGPGWDCSAVGGTVTCDLVGGLAPGQAADGITLRAQVAVAAYPSVANTAAVGSSTPDPVRANDTSTDNVNVPALADVAVVKTHPQALRVGRNGSYRIRVSNLGPLPSAGPLTVTDVLPVGLTFVNADSLDWFCSNAGQTVTCVDADGMAPGAPVTTIVLIVAVGPAAFPSVTNTASLTATTRDPDLTNNTSFDAAAVLPN